MRFSPWTPQPYRGTVYRNIATCHPKQKLYDDITTEEEKLDRLVQATSGIEHASFLEIHRPFQYGNLDDDLLQAFKREGWRLGRFGDGLSYGVWYSAEDEATSLYEASYWAYRVAIDNVLSHGEVYSADRTMYVAQLEANRSVDLPTVAEDFARLVHPRDYSYCQALGHKAVSEGVEMLRSPSARRREGTCTPVFQAMVIKTASATRILHLNVRPDGFIVVESRDGQLSFTLEAGDLENPHSIA